MNRFLYRITLIVVGLAALPSLLLAQDAPLSTSYEADVIADANDRFAPVLRQFIAEQRAACSRLDDGELTVNLGSVQYAADFNGDGVIDPVIFGSMFDCSTSATLFHGFGAGQMIDVFVSTNNPEDPYHQFSFMGLGSTIVWMDSKAILLMAHDGVACDGLGSEICFAAYSWLNDKFVAASGTVEKVLSD